MSSHGAYQIRAGRHISIRSTRGETKPQGCQKCWEDEARWNEESLIKEAKKYRYRVDFQRNSKGAYLSALRKGILNSVCAHMDRKQVERGHWNLENCRLEAIRYTARSEFMRGSGSAYNASLSNGWLDEICKHMTKEADGFHYMVYGIINRRLNKAYAGITKQRLNRRIQMHKQGGSTRASEIAGYPDTEFVRLADYCLLSSELRDAEREWAEHLGRQGFEVLNDERLFGRTGVSRRVYTDVILLQEALKYRSRADFKRGSPRHYNAACSQRKLDEVCAHMRSINAKHYWTKERCIEVAKTCSHKDEFAKCHTSAYSAARENGWLESVYKSARLRGKNEMSWLKTGTRKDIWCHADHFYKIWTENDQCGTWRMKAITGFNLDKLLKKFQSGWVPLNDSDWKDWAEENKKLSDESNCLG